MPQILSSDSSFIFGKHCIFARLVFCGDRFKGLIFYFYLTMFECQEFEDACKELDDPVIDEYDFFVEAMNVKIYRKYREVFCLIANSRPLIICYPPAPCLLLQ